MATARRSLSTTRRALMEMYRDLLRLRIKVARAEIRDAERRLVELQEGKQNAATEKRRRVSRAVSP